MNEMKSYVCIYQTLNRMSIRSQYTPIRSQYTPIQSQYTPI